MSLFADGGWFATKPYICGSSYILKMSDYPKGEWTDIWDGLYWRFVSRHRALFERNPRMRAALGSLEKMDPSRRERIFAAAEAFIERTAPPASR
jgi:deoxyribodipyrimidine photolyase-related protein